jgi:beta-lactamase regulating signal transducer with metallopeptidase domain
MMAILAHSADSFFVWLWRASWQASVVIALVAVAQALFHRQLGARWRHWLWLLVIIRLALPCSVESPLSLFNWFRPGSSPITAMGENHAVQAIRQPDAVAPAEPLGSAPPQNGWKIALRRLWSAGAALLLAHVVATSLRFNRAIRRQRPVTDGAVLDLLEDCKQEMGVCTPLALVETPSGSSPALMGAVRPRLLLPEGLIRSFSRTELRYVFLHELAHLKRSDIPLNWLLSLVSILHWFNPLVWYAFHRLRADRELACDALALAQAQDAERRPYGQTILKLLENFTRSAAAPGVLGILESQTHMRRRITMIAKFKRNTGWPVLAGAVGIVIAVLTLTDAKSGQAPGAANEEHQAKRQGTPRIMSTSPAIGETEVSPSITEITVTFDRDMEDGFSWTGSGRDYPPVPEAQKAHWRDKRTCVLPVKLETAHFYRVGINSTSFQSFRSENGRPARPAAIYFTTAGASDDLKEKVSKPIIVTLEPTNGSKEVDPNTKELRVTFNVEMGDGFSWTGGGPEFPIIPEGKRPLWTEDHKTCVLPVHLEPGREYHLGLNSPSHKNFQSAGGVPLEPTSYTFSTKQ